MANVVLEVIALDADDARAAEAGGADRLEVVADMAADGLTPSVATVAAIRRACGLPIRVMLRDMPDFAVGDLEGLARKASALCEAGADGVVLGFLDDTGMPDIAAMTWLGRSVGVPWTCHRCVDHAADYHEAVAAVSGLAGTGLDQVLTGGGPSGLRDGLSNVLDVATTAPILAGGGLTTDAVPALVAAGVTGLHVGSAVRDSWDAPVDAARVRAWRRLISRQ